MHECDIGLQLALSLAAAIAAMGMLVLCRVVVRVGVSACCSG